MYYPSQDEARQLAKQGNLIPIYRDIPADLETPVSAYLKVAIDGPSFLLESVEGGNQFGRYSFIGTDPYKILKTGPNEKAGSIDPLTSIEEELNKYQLVTIPGLPRFIGGAIGYLSYEVARYFENLPSPDPDPVALPESIFLFSDTLVVFDHLKHTMKVISHARIDSDGVDSAYQKATTRIDKIVKRLEEPLDPKRFQQPNPDAEIGPVTSNRSQEEHEDAVSKAREYIADGECIQIVVSQRFSKKTTASPFDIYRSFRALNPSPYMYHLDLEDFHIIGTSPELLVRVEEGTIESRPIAGTIRRGETEEEDVELAKQLLSDEKEKAEHIMLVDLARNDVGRISTPGSVKVTQLMEIEKYSHVQHIVSHVTGELSPELTAYDAIRSCFPHGTVSGAPKIRAMELIAELEPHQRGPYSGAVGYFGFDGNTQTAIAIRTVVMKDGIAHVQAGGGIVYDSIPEVEHNETVIKAQGALKAIENAEERTAAFLEQERGRLE